MNELVWKYTIPIGGEVPIGTRIRLKLPSAYGKLATITAYHKNIHRVRGSQFGYHILPDKGFTPPAETWIVFREWFEVLR